MKLNATLAVSAVALLAACGGGSNGVSSNPTINQPILGVIDAVRKIEIPEGADRSEIIELLSTAEGGDYVEFPLGFLENTDISSGPLAIYVVGNTIGESKVILYSTVPPTGDIEGDRILLIYPTIEAALDSFIIYSDENATWTDLYNGPEGALTISQYANTEERFALMAQNGDANVYIDKIYIDGTKATVFSVFSWELFALPSGAFDYTGWSIVQWDGGNELAQGEVQMSVTFSNSESTATIDAPNLNGEGSTAHFSGNLVIDGKTGAYSSTSATLAINGNVQPAGVLGIFTPDAEGTAGVIFDMNTVGEQVNGVFGMTRE